MTKKKTPPLRSTPVTRKEQALDQFAQAAGVRKNDEILPWEEPQVREDVIKNLPLRLTEPLYLKLKYIAAKTPYSMNSFILERLSEVIDQEIKNLTMRQ